VLRCTGIGRMRFDRSWRFSLWTQWFECG
jgi:hypothetical protein